MMSFFEPKKEINNILDILLEDIQKIPKDLPPYMQLRLKMNNDCKGVPIEKQKLLEQLKEGVDRGHFNKENSETLRELIDVLTLLSNHLDQRRNPNLPLHIKEEKVLAWLEAGYKIAEILAPGIVEKISQNPNACQDYKPEDLSTLCNNFIFLAKARRYNPDISPAQRLPILKVALCISQYLETLDKQVDPHYYADRTSTAEIAMVYILRDLGSYDEAIEIMEAQLKRSYETKSDFQVIQCLVQLSEIARDGKRIEEAINYAEKALGTAENSEEDFTKNPIYFNARKAVMEAYHAAGDMDKATTFAEAIVSEYAKNPNCGAKQGHLDAADKILSHSIPSLTC